MMGGAKAHYDGIVAFSQTDSTEDLKKITVPRIIPIKYFTSDSDRHRTRMSQSTSHLPVTVPVPCHLLQRRLLCLGSLRSETRGCSRDGRFLVLNSITESTPPVVLVANWDMELKK
jgi:hypothetical protein